MVSNSVFEKSEAPFMQLGSNFPRNTRDPVESEPCEDGKIGRGEELVDCGPVHEGVSITGMVWILTTGTKFEG
jgi:hypothetical protein